MPPASGLVLAATGTSWASNVSEEKDLYVEQKGPCTYFPQGSKARLGAASLHVDHSLLGKAAARADIQEGPHLLHTLVVS